MEQPNVLHLIASEKDAFSALSPQLREGWKVQDETQVYKDSPKSRELRFMIARFHDPKLLAIREKFKSVETDEDFIALMESIDYSAMSEADLGQIMFALGPDAVGVLILGTIQAADSDEDLIMAANFSALRHELLSSLELTS